jgi:hypothetical protein
MDLSKDDVAGLQKNITYFKDQFGLCYAAVSFYTYGGNIGTSIATVPCAAVELRTDDK